VDRLRVAFPHASATQLKTSHVSATALAHLPPPIHAAFLQAYASSLDKAFEVAAFVSICAFVASWFIEEKPMRTTVTTTDVGGSFAMPRSDESLAEIIRALGMLVGRKQMRAYFERVASEAGVGLPVTQCWLLVQVRRGNAASLAALAERSGVPIDGLESATEALVARGLVLRRSPDEDGGAAFLELTPAGSALADQLLAAVRERLARLLDGWSPDQYPDLVKLLHTFATEVVPSRSLPAPTRSAGG
jgi:DNA-binding MarR family transcriptional regulator